MKFRFYFNIFLISICILLSCSGLIYSKQDNPVKAPNIQVVPVIDGIGNDACWQNVPWQTIDQVWIPYGAELDSTDFYGRYKVVWSSATNLLYFLIEVQDDIIVDGFLTDPKGNIYDYDMTEVFIDENASGGYHRYDKGTENAENAFGYHMFAPFPADGETSHELYVDDMAGAGGARVVYTTHFPEFAIHLNGNTAVREFSLIVYNDTYSETNKDAARSQLVIDKIMGLSIACNDTDDPDANPIRRENMIGSVSEPSPGNLHWENANYFGKIKLVQEIPAGINNEKPVQVSVNSLKLYPNPSSNSTWLQLDTQEQGNLVISVFNLLGQRVFQTTAFKSGRVLNQRLNLSNFAGGIYFIQAQMQHSTLSEKLIITGK